MLECKINGGEVHSYQIALITGQFLQVIVEQRGIDLVIISSNPTGEQIAEIDNPTGMYGRERILLLAESTGNYQLKIKSLEKDAIAGHYSVRIEQSRVATKQDHILIAAQRAFAEGGQLYAKATAETFKSAIEKFTEAFQHWKAADDSFGQISTLIFMGIIAQTVGENLKALDYFNQALSLSQTSHDRFSEATLIHNIGTIYQIWGDNKKALDHFKQALLIVREIGDRLVESRILAGIAIIHTVFGDARKALDYFNDALNITQEIGDRVGEAGVLQNLGQIYSRFDQNPQALDYLQQALALARANGNRYWEAKALIGLGISYGKTGEMQRALSYLNEGLVLMLETGDRVGQANSLASISVVYSSFGEYQKALDHLSQALTIEQEVGDRIAQTATLSNMGVLHQRLGEHTRALKYYREALTLGQAIGDITAQVYALLSIGLAYDSLEDNQKALDYFNQSLELTKTTNNHILEADILVAIGNVYRRLGESQKALDYFHRALILKQTKYSNTSRTAYILANIGISYHILGEMERSLNYFHKALEIYQSEGNKIGEATMFYHIALLEQKRNNLMEARLNIETALNIIESLRFKIINRGLRTSYFSSFEHCYDDYINILMQLHQLYPLDGYNGKALEVSERARARTLLETLTESKLNIRRDMEPTLLEREHQLRHLLNTKAENQMYLLNEPHTKEQDAELKEEIDKLLLELQQIEAKIRIHYSRYSSLTQPQTLKVSQIQHQVMDADTVLLEYWLGKEQSYLWVVTNTSINSYILPKRAEIESLALRVYDLLTARSHRPYDTIEKRKARVHKADTAYREVAAQLSQILLAPVVTQIENKRLVIVTHAALDYIPFSALPSPIVSRVKPHNQVGFIPLIANHEIVNLPSASILAVLKQQISQRNPATRSVAVFADPVFSKSDSRVIARVPQHRDSQVKKFSHRVLSGSPTVEKPVPPFDLSYQGLKRLPYTRREARAILALVPPSERKEALDFKANRFTAIDPNLKDYRFIHFATHALLNDNHPELSGIVLSLVNEQGIEQSGFLNMYELYDLNLSAEVVVLSACRTGLGKQVKGEGLIGLTRGFMYAGAARVVASLWAVNDLATAELMARFYQNMLGRKRLKPVLALRAAQISMWKEKKWRAPYYWAAFVLQGEPN
ncbi:MAG: CHAT domain-containing protein [Acidobacteriota bacterium]